MLTIALLIILSPVILIASIVSLFIIFAIVYSIVMLPVGVIKRIREDEKLCQKQEDQKNTQKQN